MDHDRRGGWRHEALRSCESLAAGSLPSVTAEGGGFHDAGGEIGNGSRRADGGDSRRSCFHRQRSTGVRRCDDATTDAGFCFDAAYYFHCSRILQRPGAGAGGYWNLRRDLLLGGAAHAGNRDSHGAGGTARTCVEDGNRAGREDCGRGYTNRDRCLPWTYSLDDEASIFRSPCRSGDVCDSDSYARADRPAGLLYPSAAHASCRSSERAAERVVATFYKIDTNRAPISKSIWQMMVV